MSDDFEEFALIHKTDDLLCHTALPLTAYVMGSSIFHPSDEKLADGQPVRGLRANRDCQGSFLY